VGDIAFRGGGASELPAAPSPLALARLLAWGPVEPRSLLAAIEEGLYLGLAAPARFVEIVEATFPADRAARRAILGADGDGRADEAAAVEAFLAAVERRLFPVEDGLEDYATLVQGIPFRPLGFEDGTLEELADRPGYQALIALLAPDAPAAAARAHLLHERCGVPTATLALLPVAPPALALLGGRFGGGTHAAVVDMARWLRAETGTTFLDSTCETAEWCRWAWTARHVAALTAQWAVADALLGRVNALATWLEGDLPTRLRGLLLRLPGRRTRGRGRRAARRRPRRRGRAWRAS